MSRLPGKWLLLERSELGLFPYDDLFEILDRIFPHKMYGFVSDLLKQNDKISDRDAQKLICFEHDVSTAPIALGCAFGFMAPKNACTVKLEFKGGKNEFVLSEF